MMKDEGEKKNKVKGGDEVARVLEIPWLNFLCTQFPGDPVKMQVLI